VRLDHLLSKEHSTARRYTTGFTVPSHFGNTCFPVALMGGTLTLMQNQTVRSQYSAALFTARWMERVAPGGFACARCWVLRDRNDRVLPGWTVPLDLFLFPSVGDE